MWVNDYIGLPYLNRGRDRSGVDCWGLVRLVYAERYAINLPSFGDTGYDATNSRQVAELFNRREGWGSSDTPATGDLVLLRVRGYPSHVGIITAPGTMLHVNSAGHTSCVERIDSGKWKHRIDGYYRHESRASGIVLSGCPHPLKTMHINSLAPEGASLLQIVQVECSRANVPDELSIAQGHAWIEGEYIPASEWGNRYPVAGQRVEYRVLPAGGGGTRALLTLAVMVAIAVVAPYIAAALGSTLGVAAGSAGALALQAGVGLALNYVGAMLINAIAPIRQPTEGNGGGESKSKYQLQGGSNNVAPYAAIPVTLGQFRWTPLSAANPYVEYSSTDTYLRMVLCWGYGPVDVSDMRIGDTPLSNFDDVEVAHLRGVTGEDKTAFNALYGLDTGQDYPGVKLELLTPVDRTTGPDVDHISVTINYPMGLGYIHATDGNLYPLGSLVSIRIRPAGSTVAWAEVAQTIYAKTLLLPPVYDEETITKDGGTDIGDWWFATYGTTKSKLGDAGRLPLYQWNRITLDKSNKLIVRSGALTDNKYAAPSAALLAIMEAHNFGLPVTYDRLPAAGSGEEKLWLICVNGETITDVIDERDLSVTGCALTTSGLSASIADGSITRVQVETINRFNATKDAFDHVVGFSVPRGQYDVRVQTYTDHSAHIANYPNDAMLIDEIFTTLTWKTNVRPVNFSKPLAMTAIRIRASNQINGNMEGITGTVKSVCLDWSRATGTWITRNTRNPASLYRYVLQHPANAVPVADAAIDLVTLQRWHNYCVANGFAFDMIITGQRPLLDVLRDIAAAGRASPQLVDGKWTVVIDEPKPIIVQHFTPHNSWGFEGSRILPKMLHALRITFYNKAKGFVSDERIIYADGYSSLNATLIEAIELPGVTDEVNVHAFGRFHLAQLALRPDEYSLSADMEHLICTRGDKVRVTHDVPMWGLGSGRIREVLIDGATATGVVVDESLPMDAGVSYSLRIRRNNGASQICTVVPAVSDGHYNTLMFTAPITASLIAANNLVLYGINGSESVELLVKGIEPDNVGNAKITFVDYAPGVFNADEETIPAWSSQITLPPVLLQSGINSDKTPIIKDIATDESALTLQGDGSLQCNIKIAYQNPAGLPTDVSNIEVQYAMDDADPVWSVLPSLSIVSGVVWISNVRELATYTFRMRYVSAQGLAGKWITQAGVVVIGRTRNPEQVTGLIATPALGSMTLDWNSNSELDVNIYEVRTSDSGWGGVGYVFRGSASACKAIPGAAGIGTTWYVKARDRGGRYSDVAATLTYTVAAPSAPSTLTATFADTSLTNATITLDWPDVTPVFGLSHYIVNYSVASKTVKSSTITLPADWIGVRQFGVYTVDLLGNVSEGRNLDVSKSLPGSVSNFYAQVIDNNVLLYWTLPTKTTLPIGHIKLKKGATWSTAVDIGTKSGSFTSLNELASGTYTYWAAVVDTDNNEGSPTSVTAKVSEPPDFVFHGSQASTFSATKSSAIVEQGAVILPFNTSDTFAQHFTNNAWSTPDDQIAAGFPIFAQPTPTPGYYEEVFNFGTILASSRVTVGYTGTVLAGSPLVSCDISLSDDNVIWATSYGVTEVYGTNFRYAKVRLTVSQDADTHALYKISTLSVRADAKLKNDAGNAACLSTDVSGTVVNFNLSFIDVTSLVVTPSGTTPVTPVYNFQDAVINGTYSVVSNVVTISATAHDLVAGQKVRLSFTSGTAPNGVYPVASVISANQYTVAITTANTSGNISTYPQGFRIYLFNSAGSRVSGTASWSAKGY